MIYETFKLELQINLNTTVVGDFHVSLSPIDSSLEKKKLDREAVEMNKVISQMDLADIYSIFHSNSREHTFFPAAMECSLK